MLKGDLSLFSLGEIFQSLAINTHTGTLKIVSPGRSERLICFQQGEIVYYCDDGRSDRVPQLGEILVRLQLITPGQLEQALAEQRASKEMLGEVLLKQGVVREAELSQALETQTLEGLYELFLLKEGTFEFQMNVLPEALQTGLWKRIPISLNTSRVIMEGLRQVDEWGLINQHIRTFDEIFRRVDILASPPDESTALLLEMVNGARPVKDLFKSYQGSRFNCAKRLCSLIEEGYIRALTDDELKSLAQEKTAARQHQQAAAYLTFASQINPGDPSTLADLADSLFKIGEEAAARTANLTCLRRYFEQGDYLNAARVGETRIDSSSLNEEDLEQLFFCYVKLQNFKRASLTGGQLAAMHQKDGNFEKAAIVMEAIAAMNPSDLNLKIQVATLFEKAGNVELATRELEEVAAALEREKKYRELVKILRLLSQLNPKRQDLKQKIAATHAMIEMLARRRKLRVTVAGVSTIALLVLGVIPILYEIKARESYSYATSLEQSAMLTLDFKRAKEAYLTIVKSYYFSTKVAEAQEGLERISHLEQTYLSRIEAEAAQAKERQESRLGALKDELASRLREAERLEQAGDLQAAHATYALVSRDFAEIPAVKGLTLPLRVTTDPPGATVQADDAALGKTPFVYRYKPGTRLNLNITRASCQPAQQSVELTDQWQLHYKLQRTPLARMSLVPTITQSMAAAQDRILAVSRDGNLYAITPQTRSIAWQRMVGRYGDRTSDLELRRDEVYLATVNGEVSALSIANGKSRWITRIDSSVLAAPAVSADGRHLAIGATSGEVLWLDNQNGAVLARFHTENEIVSKPYFAGTTLLAGSTDNHVYAFSLKSQAAINELELADDVVGDLLPFETSVLTYTANGTVYRIESQTLNVLWSRQVGKLGGAALCVNKQAAFAGTQAGVVVGLDLKTGEKLWEQSLGKGAVSGLSATAARVYVTLETGSLTSLDATSGGVDWSHVADAAILAPPLVTGQALFVGYMTGKIEQWELIE